MAEPAVIIDDSTMQPYKGFPTQGGKQHPREGKKVILLKQTQKKIAKQT